MKFMDMRQWIALLEKEGELRRITAEVDWNREIGAIARRVLEKKGPALLFESIKGYRNGRCTKLFASGLGAQSRLALALGFGRDVANRDLIQYVMKKNREMIAPVIVERSSCAAMPSIRLNFLSPNGSTWKAAVTSTPSPAS
jgi:UbiD family decarboxylase